MRYCLFHIFAIFSNGRGNHFGFVEKIVIASCEDLCNSRLVWIHLEILENFMLLLCLATAADGHLGLSNHINLKQLHFSDHSD